MHPVSFLLRLLLCLGLLANGVGAAQGAVRMQLAHATQSMPATAGDAAGQDCHETSRPAPASDGMHASASQHGGDADAAGCCDDGDACRCLCVAQASLALGIAPVSKAMTARDDGPRADASLHRPPRLAHLIRPPIG